MKYAICNETFGGWEHARVCATVAELGYTGLELAPFTLAPLITEVSASQRQLLRRQAEQAGLQIIGLHWLLAKTNGFHLTSDDTQTQQRTGQYLAELARCAADLGGDILVLGSPLQRTYPKEMLAEQAQANALATLEHCLPALADTGVSLCLEPLTPQETNFMNTAAEAVAIIHRLHHPQVRLHLDVKAMSAEPRTAAETIVQYAAYTKHFHANDTNLRGPGFGETDFQPIFAALKQAEYTGWVSVEVFDYHPDPVTIGKKSLAYMQRCAS